MRPDDYQVEVQRTESKNLSMLETFQPVYHAVIGISTEAGEALDTVKKQLIYGKPIDFTNLDEEMGDLLWYIAVYLNWRGKTFEQVMQQNIDKLRVRFPEKFTEAHALHRDLDAERASLENSGKG